MKQLLLLTCTFLCVSCLVFAQMPGSIGLFGDPDAMNCSVYDVLEAPISLYVVHLYTSGASGCEFMVICDAGMNMIYITESVTPPYVGSGNSLSGISIEYGSCVPSPNMVMTIQFLGQGTSEACSQCKIVAHPSASPPGIYAMDCEDPPNLLHANGQLIIINPDESCLCSIPVEETSWGRIKSLFR